MNPQQVIDQAKLHSQNVRVFSFGLGSGCDVDLVRGSAQAGRGTATIVRDQDPQLNGLVIRALSAAMQPSLKETQYGFNNQLCQEQEIYRNTLVSDVVLMTEAEFAELKFKFTAKEEDSQQAISMEFCKDDFLQINGEEA